MDRPLLATNKVARIRNEAFEGAPPCCSAVVRELIVLVNVKVLPHFSSVRTAATPSTHIVIQVAIFDSLIEFV